MNRLSSFLLGGAAVLLLAVCGGKTGAPAGSATLDNVKESYDVKGVSLAMKELQGGTFAMGSMKDGRMIKGTSSLSQAVMDGYAVSVQPVSQALWKAVMGGNPSSVQDDNLPVDKVSWKDAQKFVAKLGKMTGVPFILPTEAMWEFAVSEGAAVPVKNLREWCEDRFSEEMPQEITRNPAGPAEGALRVVRTDLERTGVQPDSKAGALGFRVAVRTGKPCPEAVVKAVVDLRPEREHVSVNETFTVGDVKFDMIGVAPGSFQMGATKEQADYGDEAEKPVHEVSVEGFEIGKTEVTAGLWQAVMGVLPLGNDLKQADKPVINVSWYGAQQFILKLNALTGRKFRLPTEAEWEFAARGGVKSHGYRFSGANAVGSVAIYTVNSDNGRPSRVGHLQANELGLYDMSGNAWEWVQDCFGTYGQPVEKSEWHVMRGGSAASPWNACRVSNRQKVPAGNVKGTFGFRLAL